MTNDERIALLRRVAEVAPKEMGARHWGHWEKFYSLSRPYKGDWPKVNLYESDSENATGIIAILEAMEKAGWETQVGSPNDLWSDYHCWVGNSMTGGGEPNHFGSTRAIAVARAFVRVFGGD